MYLHHIVSVPENELIHKVYSTQKHNPVKGDWVLKVGEDMTKIGLNIEEPEIKSKTEYKKIVEEKIMKTAFREYMKEKSAKLKQNI